MAQFFSYPYNYLELSEYTKKGTEESMKAAKVSDNNHDTFVEITSTDNIIKFGSGKSSHIDSVFILCENIEQIGIRTGSSETFDSIFSENSLRNGIKQYFFGKVSGDIPLNDLSLKFTIDSDIGNGKVYEIFLLEEKKVELTYNNPIQRKINLNDIPEWNNGIIYNSGDLVNIPQSNNLKIKDYYIALENSIPSSINPIENNRYWLWLNPIVSSSFSEIELVHTQEGLGLHEDIYGHQTEYRQYGYRPKYKISYTTPLQTLEEVRALQRFREENLNFTFIQDLITYPDRILPSHFSDYSLPISYSLPHLAQEKRYTIKFTIMEN